MVRRTRMAPGRARRSLRHLPARRPRLRCRATAHAQVRRSRLLLPASLRRGADRAAWLRHAADRVAARFPDRAPAVRPQRLAPQPLLRAARQRRRTAQTPLVLRSAATAVARRSLRVVLWAMAPRRQPRATRQAWCRAVLLRQAV